MFEAIRSGVRICSMKKFLDGEEYLIVRIPKLTNTQKIHLTKNAIKQLGKDYDFNFDIESPDEINCTELVYLMYDFINWNTSKLMGRNVVMPDDVFKTALNNKQLEIVTFIKGDIIKKNPQAFELPLFTK